MTSRLAHYEGLLERLGKMSNLNHLKSPPKYLNLHLRVPSPFNTFQSSTDTFKDVKNNKFLIQRASEKYENSFTLKERSDGISSFPNVIKRHLFKDQTGFKAALITAESEAAQAATSNFGSRITGFRIQIKGRNGSRSSRKVVSYGSLASGRSGSITGSMVDFGQSHFVHPKRGVTGVKIWIGYK